MKIESLDIRGFKCFKDPFKILLNSGLNVLVGENGSGKTAIISALRQLFSDSESGKYSISEQDFYKEYKNDSIPVDKYEIKASFSGLTGDERVAFINWVESNDVVTLNLLVDNQTTRGRYKKRLWGGNFGITSFDYEALDLIQCIYLPPLRDAEIKLSNGQQSRLARLIKALSKDELKKCRAEDKRHPLEDKVSTFNKELIGDSNFAIKRANELIGKSLAKAVGKCFSQSTQIQFSESNFTKIVEGLRLLYFPLMTTDEDTIFRGLEENSLGYNNLLYVASILAELLLEDDVVGRKDTFFKLLLIEEPEAHLHPQLQIRLLKYLAEVSKVSSVQVIVTTHSTVIASSVSLDSIIHIHNRFVPTATSLSKLNIPPSSKKFINRWLDVTKSNMLFARSVILVEGISEALLFPEFANIILKNNPEGYQSFDDLGVSVININGIYFEHFMRLYCDFSNLNANVLPVLCAGVTDKDPPDEFTEFEDGVKIIRKIKPHSNNRVDGLNHALKLVEPINTSKYARLFVSEFKTFEYDLALNGNNIKIMSDILIDLWQTTGPVKASLQQLSNKDWTTETPENKAEAAYEILNRISDNSIGKGLFAQMLADKISLDSSLISIPKYIEDAIKWSCNFKP